MAQETENVRSNGKPTRVLDDMDRRILGALVEDARRSYADVGQVVGLSAPAVHDRVRRMRRAGVIERIAARVDGPSVGKRFLAFVHVDAEGWGKSQRMMRLAAYPEVEEIHSVAGDTCVIIKVRTADAEALERFLSQLYILPGVRGTKSFVVLSTYLDRPVQPQITQDWPSLEPPPD